MPNCGKVTSGGKGNLNMFIERNPRICAAGIPTKQGSVNVADALQYYLLQDEVDALLGDAIIPTPKPQPLAPLRKAIPLDKRNGGLYTDVAELINPPIKNKFQAIIDEIKDTTYASYWKTPLGKSRDPVPMVPAGFDFHQTFGKKYLHVSLYDVVCPKVPNPDTKKNEPAKQQNRNYCEPFSNSLTYGHRYIVNKQGACIKQCLTDSKLIIGTGQKVVLNSIQSNFKDAKIPKLGNSLAPNNNVKDVPEGFAFGVVAPVHNLPECLSYCELNPAKALYAKYLKHLNTVKICNRKKFVPSFYRMLYLNLRYMDKANSGWLPKQTVYDFAISKRIIFNPDFIEPLLKIWGALDGDKLEYKTFAHIMNHREPIPQLPKIEDMGKECLNFETTYAEMVKPQEPDLSLRAGVPSGRYFDKDYPVTPQLCCRADRVCLPEESDMKSCISPSVMTHFHLSHRDFYSKRDPAEVRRVFEATGEQFTDDRFDALWKEAQKLHSQGWVCYETFRRVLEKA